MTWWSAIPVVRDIVEKALSSRTRHHAVDVRAADRAVLLCRTLKAHGEAWPRGPATLEELTDWARRFASGYGVTEYAIRELVDLRPDASSDVSAAIRRARDEYYQAADVVNPLVGSTYWGPLAAADGGNESAVQGQLRRAHAHVHRCITELSTVSERGQ